MNLDRRAFVGGVAAGLAGLRGFAGAPARAGAPSPVSLGLNLAPLDYWVSERAFANLAMNASRWRVQERGAPFTWDAPLPPLTADGYPTVVPAGTELESFLVFTPFRGDLSEHLSLRYDGIGVLEYRDGARLEARSSGRDDIRNLRNDGAITARLVSTSSENPLRNIRLYERGPEPSGQFREAFLRRARNMASLRFMDWMQTNNSKLAGWDARPKPGRFAPSQTGACIEHMVALANAAAVAPWFTLPHLADDDLVRRFAATVRDSLDSTLPVYVEYSNEVWNDRFEQARHARERGLALALSADPFEAQLRFQSQRTSEILAIWEDEFAAAKDRVIGVYAAQADNDWTSHTVLSWGDAARYADVLAIAPYFGASFGGPDRAETVAGWSLDQLFAALEAEVETDARRRVQAQAAVARSFKVTLAAYEGGQHLVGFDGAENSEPLAALFQSANRDERMGRLYDRHLGHWRADGGGLYVLYNSMGDYTKWGSWGLLEHEGIDGPKWAAVQRLLEQRVR